MANTVTKCENCGSKNIEPHSGTMDMVHNETGVEAEIHIDGFYCRDCAEVTVPDDEAERIFNELDNLIKKHDEIDVSQYE